MPVQAHVSMEAAWVCSALDASMCVSLCVFLELWNVGDVGDLESSGT